jgi:hypothetical protein
MDVFPGSFRRQYFLLPGSMSGIADKVAFYHKRILHLPHRGIFHVHHRNRRAVWIIRRQFIVRIASASGTTLPSTNAFPFSGSATPMQAATGGRYPSGPA